MSHLNAPLPLIIDCDPGTDDAIELLIAMAAPEKFNLLGITTMYGNVSAEKTKTNALKICELANRTDVPVYAGCERPLIQFQKFQDASYAFGSTGMDGCDLPEPTITSSNEHAVDFLIRTLMTTSQKVTIAASGTLTNLALAFLREPSIIHNIEEIVIMGSGQKFGNMTPSAEFNFYSDPHAAHVVLHSGVKITLLGLDVTHQITVTPSRLARLRAMNSRVSDVMVGMFEFLQHYDCATYGVEGAIIHDAAVVIYLLDRSLFTGVQAPVDIDIAPGMSYGRSIVDFWNKKGSPCNATVITHLDVEGIFEVLYAYIGRFAAAELLHQSKVA